MIVLSDFSFVNDNGIRVTMSKECRWHLKYCDYINEMTKKYEEINSRTECNMYKASTEEELRKEQERRLDDSWTVI